MSLTFFNNVAISSYIKKLLVISGYLRDNIFWHYCTRFYEKCFFVVVWSRFVSI
jgi:hypothetical protein